LEIAGAARSEEVGMCDEDEDGIRRAPFLPGGGLASFAKLWERKAENEWTVHCLIAMEIIWSQEMHAGETRLRTDDSFIYINRTLQYYSPTT